MSKRANPTLIGSFVIGAIAIVVFTLLALGNISLNEKTYRCVLYFQGSLHGLDVGAPVAYRGVTIGKVGDIAITFDHTENRFTIPVYIDIAEQVVPGKTHYEEAGFDTPEAFFRDMIRRGLRAKLKMRSIVTGKLFIEFFFAPDTVAQVTGQEKEYIEIPTLPSGLDQLTQILEELPVKDIVTKIISALDNINAMLESKELKQIIPLLNNSLAHADTLFLSLQQQLPELALEFKKTLADVSSLVSSTQALVEQADADLPVLINEIESSFVKINSVLDRLQPLVENLNTMTDENSSLRYRINNALQEISKTAQSVSRLSEYLQRHPDALLTGRKEQK